jgi:hypothetical protein
LSPVKICKEVLAGAGNHVSTLFLYPKSILTGHGRLRYLTPQQQLFPTLPIGEPAMLSPYETPAQVSAKHVLKTVAVCEGHGLNPISLLRKYALFARPRNQWCSLQTNVNMLQEIQDPIVELSLTEMGRKTAELLCFPRAVNTIHKAFLSLNHVYHTNHHGNVGS